MKLPRLKFTSYRDSKGYRIVGKTPPPTSPVSVDDVLKMDVGDFGLSGYLGSLHEEVRWEDDGTKDGRVIVKRTDNGALGEEWISGHIVGQGGKKQKVLLEHWPTAFEKFAAVKRPTELMEFVAEFGLLTNAKRQLVFELLYEARQMRECMQADTKLFSRDLDLKAHISKDLKTGQLETHITPSSLLDALWLQLEQSQQSGAEFRKCLHCSRLFSVGGNSGRLRFAKFCSDEHRKEFNSRARSNPALRAKRGKPKRAFFARHRKSMKGADR
jgi:hypothetical protein